MKRFLLILVLCATAEAQLWSGILSTSRAIDWSGAGVVGGIPSASWTQCGATVSPGTSIQTAINNCGSNQYVQLAAGNFTSLTGLVMKSNMELRGMGADQTFLTFTAATSCNGANVGICFLGDSIYYGSASIQPGQSNAATWTAGYSQGATSITLSSIGSVGVHNGDYIFLDQANTTTIGANYFVCDTLSVCRPSTESAGLGRTVSGVTRGQLQIVKVVSGCASACTGTNGGAGFSLTITPGVYPPNIVSGQSPGAWFGGQITRAGVRNLSLDTSAIVDSGNDRKGIQFAMANNCWVQGTRQIRNSTGTTSGSARRSFIELQTSAHITITDNYFYANTAGSSVNYSIEEQLASDNLIQNNIVQLAGPILSLSTGSVIAYNYIIDMPTNPPGFRPGGLQEHDAGPTMDLWEGNITPGFISDNFHGNSNMGTLYRNRMLGTDTGSTQNRSAIQIWSSNRYHNVIANVLGNTGFTTYTQDPGGQNSDLVIYALGGGNQLADDSLVRTTLMRWGNYDTVNSAVRWVAGEVPSGISPYPNAVPTTSCTSGIACPDSFYLSSKPSWFGSLAYPAIGPEFAANISAITNPARNCALNTMGMPANGSGSVLAFNAATCYASTPAPPALSVTVAKLQGRIKLVGSGGIGVANQSAQLPQQWVHNYITADADGDVSKPDTQPNAICNFSTGFPGGDVTVKSGGDFALTVAGLQAAIDAWDGTNRRISIAAGGLINSATYTNFQGTSPAGIAYAQNALIAMKVIASPAGCLLIESDNPPQRYRTLCANYPPDNTRPRNPNCTGDVAHLWTIRQDHYSGNDTSYAALYFPPGANHIIVRDGEFTILPGDAQSTTGAHGRSPILADAESHDLGLEYVWVHGWNPGDAAGASPRTWTGQPTSNAALNSDGTCKNWNHTGTVSTNGTQVIWRSGDRFGGDFSDGVNLYGHTYVDAQAKIYIGGTAGVWHSGTQYTIASGGHDPTDMSVMTCSDGGGPGTGTMTCGDKVLTLSTSAGVQTDVVYNMSNPFAAMTPGCGDDLSNGVTWYANNSWIMWSQINKMHYWQTEGHSLLVGFQNGPLKIAHNNIEAGAGGIFFGGGAVDVSRQGPVKDVEIRNNYIGNDLWEKYLSAAQRHSPGPPWGCGPLDEEETDAANHDTCTFQHSKKNPLELKFCVNCLLDANDVEGSWTDGQNGLVGAWPNRNCSGGTLCGIFDASGLPRVGIKHQTITNNLFHDGGQGIALGARCGGPGNGGGLCFPSSYEDVKNNIFYNIDAKEFGNQSGNFSNMLMNIGDTGQTYLCTMSRTNGTAHAHCANGSFTGPSSNVSIVRIVRTGTPGQKNGVVTIEYGNRKDLLVGGTVTLAVTGTGASNFNGTFTITGVENNINSTHSTTACDNNATPWVNATNQPCIGNTGRYSDTMVYTDTVNTQVASTDTLCASGTGTTCSTGVLGTDALSAMSLAYSATDIIPGQDPVLIYTGNYLPGGNSNHGAGMGCSDNNAAGYATSGLATLPLAALPGSAAGLDVYYAQSTLPDDSAASRGFEIYCFLDNGAGQGQHLTIANNTIVSGDALSITNNALTSQERYTTIANNVYVAPDNSQGTGSCIGKRSFLTVPTSASTCEGTPSLASFDQSTFKFYGNVIGLARTPSNWCTSPTGITCPAIGGSLVNSFPAAFADIGFATTQAQQSGGCNKSLAPFNCPLMSLPWADNLKLSDLVISGAYAGKGADISAITAARASTKYTCATPCGSAGPYKDAP